MCSSKKLFNCGTGRPDSQGIHNMRTLCHSHTGSLAYSSQIHSQYITKALMSVYCLPTVSSPRSLDRKWEYPPLEHLHNGCPHIHHWHLAAAVYRYVSETSLRLSYVCSEVSCSFECSDLHVLIPGYEVSSLRFKYWSVLINVLMISD